ncbi:MAG: hypothetical protein ACPGVH_08280 [Chitinophagales bacterium]
MKKKIDTGIWGFDLARDLDHSGKLSNNLVFEYFKEQISKIK